MLWLRDGDRGAYLGLQVLVRAEAEGLCPRAFQFSTSLWEEMLPSDPTVSCQFLVTKVVPSYLCGMGTIEHSQDRQAGIPILCKQLLPQHKLARPLLGPMCLSASSHWASPGSSGRGKGTWEANESSRHGLSELSQLSRGP